MKNTRRKGGFFSRLFGRRRTISPRMEKDRIEEEYQARIDHIDRQFLIVQKEYSEKEKDKVKRQNLKLVRLLQIEDEIKSQIDQDRRSGNLQNKAYYNKLRNDKISHILSSTIVVLFLIAQIDSLISERRYGLTILLI
jgi:hypothetical protein